ncbi:MAG: sulfatase-like hydrolase/transferase [Pseudomonadota bacterium]
MKTARRSIKPEEASVAMLGERQAPPTVAARAALLVLLAMSLLISAQATSEPTGRNLLFIAIDDLRDWTGYSGQYEGAIFTPNIDALANASTRYLRAYTTLPSCLGSRTSVMLGLSPATHGVGLFSSSSPGVNSAEFRAIYGNADILSLPEVLRGHGYYTAAAGKVFHQQLPDRWQEVGPETRIAELFNAFEPGPDDTFIVPQVLDPATVHPDQAVADWGAAFIRDYASSEPFFLALGFYQPHLPWRVPQWAYDFYPLEEVVAQKSSPRDLDDEPVGARELAASPIIDGVAQYDRVEAAGKAAEYTQAYLASVTHTDAMLGEVIEALQRSPYAENTDILLWSDHGYHLGDKFHWRKQTFWEAAVRVPLLISSPGNAQYPVGDESQPVSLLDIAPTVLELAGLPRFAQFEGLPLSRAREGRDVKIFLGKGQARLRNGIKVVDYDRTREQGLNDLSAYWLALDPYEEVNIIVPLVEAILGRSE